MKKHIAKKVKIQVNEAHDGVTIWINGCWVLDASMFKDDLMFSVDTNRMKVLKKNQEYSRHKVYEFYGDKHDELEKND